MTELERNIAVTLKMATPDRRVGNYHRVAQLLCLTFGDWVVSNMIEQTSTPNTYKHHQPTSKNSSDYKRKKRDETPQEKLTTFRQ